VVCEQVEAAVCPEGGDPQLLAATNGDLTSFHTADRLAGVAGLAPVPRDSGRITGNLKRPRRYDRRLRRVFYLAANNSIRTCSQSRDYL
jgi:transposase